MSNAYHLAIRVVLSRRVKEWKMKKLNLITVSIISTFTLSACARDYSLRSTKQLCIDYLNRASLHAIIGNDPRRAELEKREVSSCGPYEAEAQATKSRVGADTGETFRNLRKPLRVAQRNLGCTQWTVNRYGQKQCLN